MPAKEIKELRQAGKLDEAYAMAKAEFEAEPTNIWAKRNVSWVYYDFLKQNCSDEHFDSFIFWLNEINTLRLPAEEKMFYENLSWQVGKMAFIIIKYYSDKFDKAVRLFESIKGFSYPKPSEGYSFLFKGLHRGLKETSSYIEFADWWDFKYFREEDYEKEILPTGKEVMSIVEQAYIAYSKHLLPKQNQHGDINFNKERAEAFLPLLSQIVEDYPQYQYPSYFHAKLLLALGDKENTLESLLPFARKKRNDFWVWEILAEAFSSDPEKIFACYCKALSCKSPDEMLVRLRQKMARLLIARKLYKEARTEIDLLVYTRKAHNFKIPAEVANWQGMDWYKTAVPSKSNLGYYKLYLPFAEALLFSDIPEETVIVEFVNADKKILNFISSETKFGFFKYDRFFSTVNVGDTLKVRFQSGSNEGIHQLYTASNVNDDIFRNIFMKKIVGLVKIANGKPFGFIDGVYIHPSLIKKYKLTDGLEFSGEAMKSYNKEKKQWGWKII